MNPFDLFIQIDNVTPYCDETECQTNTDLTMRSNRTELTIMVPNEKCSPGRIAQLLNGFQYDTF